MTTSAKIRDCIIAYENTLAQRTNFWKPETPAAARKELAALETYMATADAVLTNLDEALGTNEQTDKAAVLAGIFELRRKAAALDAVLAWQVTKGDPLPDDPAAYLIALIKQSDDEINAARGEALTAHREVQTKCAGWLRRRAAAFNKAEGVARSPEADELERAGSELERTIL